MLTDDANSSSHPDRSHLGHVYALLIEIKLFLESVVIFRASKIPRYFLDFKAILQVLIYKTLYDKSYLGLKQL